MISTETVFLTPFYRAHWLYIAVTGSSSTLPDQTYTIHLYLAFCFLAS